MTLESQSSFWRDPLGRRENPLGLRGMITGMIAVAILLALFILLTCMAGLVAVLGIEARFFTDSLVTSLIILPMVYGAVRGGVYHPASNPRYLKWLRTTPWKPGIALPMGPVRLVGTDYLLLASATSISVLVGLLNPRYDPWLMLLAPVAGFSLIAAGIWSIVNAITGQRWHVYAALAIPAIVGMLQLRVESLIICPPIMAAIALHGALRSLQSFPWPNCHQQLLSAKTTTPPIIGWPLNSLLARKVEEVYVGWKLALLEALLAACIASTLVRLIGEKDPAALNVIRFAFAIGSIGMAGIRIYYYHHAICSRLCWGYRWANRQPIVWRHDRVFVVPTLIIAAGIVLPTALEEIVGLPTPIAMGSTIGVVVLLVRGVGPSVHRMHLTGIHSKLGATFLGQHFRTANDSK